MVSEAGSDTVAKEAGGAVERLFRVISEVVTTDRWRLEPWDGRHAGRPADP